MSRTKPENCSRSRSEPNYRIVQYQHLNQTRDLLKDQDLNQTREMFKIKISTKLDNYSRSWAEPNYIENCSRPRVEPN